MKKYNILPTLLIFSAFFVLPAFAFSQQLDNLSSQKPVTFHGTVGANLIGYSSSGIDNRMDPFGMVLSGNATLSVYGVSMPFSFRFSDKKMDYVQPFNQFGLSPSYKWITLHGGYRSVKFSDFTMAGHTFLGGGVELNPGKFRFGAVYGRFKKNTGMFENERDTVRTFNRKGYAIKMGVGSKKNFVDLVVLRIQDDSLSVTDSKGFLTADPEQNVVTGINSFFTFSKTLTFEAEIAASLYTTDASVKPFSSEDEPILEKVNKFIVINESSEFTTAAKSALNYKSKLFGLRAEYRRIDPKYKSMGAYYFNDDVENFTIAPSVPLFQKKLYLRGSIGLQRDNLRNSKLATTKRTISSANISFNPVPVFGIDLNYSNYSNNQKAGRMPVIDTIRVFQTTSNFTVAPRLMFATAKYNQMVMAIFNRSGLHDKNATTAEFSESAATIVNLNYNINFNESLLGLMAGVNYTALENFAGVNKVTGFTAGANKSWMEGAINGGINTSIMRANYMDDKGWIYSHSLNGSYQINQHHNVRLNLYLTSQKFPDGSVNKKFNEFKADLSYAYTF
jgi:hypothetical protein